MRPRLALLGVLAALAACAAEGEAGNEGSAGNARAAESDPDPDVESLRSRARRAVQAGGGGAIRETLSPFRLSARSLGGTAGTIHWGVSAWGVRELQVPSTPDSRAMLVIEKPRGRLTVEMANANGWRFYVECGIQPTPETLPVRWDALMSQAGPVNGVATRDPATNRYYFATPLANQETRPVYFTIDPLSPNTGNEGYLVIHDCDVLPFR